MASDSDPARVSDCAVLFFEFFQVAVDRRFRAGVAERDTYRVDRRVLPLREQRVAGAFDVHAAETSAGHRYLLRISYCGT